MKATKLFTLILGMAILALEDAASGQPFIVNWDVVDWAAGGLDKTDSAADDPDIGPGTVSFAFGGDKPPKCIDPPPDMVAWYPGDDCEPTDFLGNHHGTFEGFPFCPIDFKVGDGALGFFPGTYVVVPDAPALNIGSGNFCIDLWTKTSADGYRPIVEKGSGDRPGYALRLQSGKLYFAVCANTCSSVLSTVSGQLNDDTWHHIAATYSRGAEDQIHIYIDGAPAGSLMFEPLGVISSVDNLWMGAGPSGTGSPPTTFFDGEMDEIEIFRRALDPSEIEAIFLARSAGKCKCVEPPPDMVAWFPADPSRPECDGYLRDDAFCGLDDGKVDAAFRLDGDGDYVEVPDDPALRFKDAFGLSTNLTIEAWIQHRIAGGVQIQPIVDKRNTPTCGYYLYLTDGLLAFQLLDGVVQDPFIDNSTLPADTWNHVAVTVDRGKSPDGGKLYLNGEVVHTFSPEPPVPGCENLASDLLIGHNQSFESPSFFDGLIDEVELFDRALTLQEIRSIFLAGSAGKCKPCRGRGIRVSQESAPDIGDFDENVLGCIDPFAISYPPPTYYQWDQTVPASFSNPDFHLTDDRSHLFFVVGAGSGLSLVIVHDEPDPGTTLPGGSAEMYFELFGDPNGAYRTLKDDPCPQYPYDTYIPDANEQRSWVFASMNGWETCCTDGQVLTELNGNWVMFVEFTEFKFDTCDDTPRLPVISGLESWWAHSLTDGTQFGRWNIPLALEEDRRVRLDCCPLTCTLDPNGEVCDDGDDCTADDQCSGGVCVGEYQVQVYADICEPFDPPNAPQPDLDDILCELDDFADGPGVDGCACNGFRMTTDLHPCPEDGGGDGLLVLDDILNMLDAFAGLSPCDDPCPG